MKQHKKGQFGGSILSSVFILGLLIVGCYIFHKEKTAGCEIKEDVTPIYSLNLNNEMQGSFILGIGGFGTETYYYFYKQDENGVLLDKENAEYLRIIEDDDNIPSLREYSCSCTFATCENIPKRALYVPEGTIRKQYDVNPSGLGVR